MPCLAARPPTAPAIAQMDLALSAFLSLTWSPTSVAMAAPARHQQQATAAKPCQKPKRQRPSGPPSHVRGKQWKDQEGKLRLGGPSRLQRTSFALERRCAAVGQTLGRRLQ